MPLMIVLMLLLSPLEQAMEALTDGRYEEAIERFKTVLAEDSSSYDARMGLARAYSWSSRYVDAENLLDGILKENPDDVDALLARGQVRSWRELLTQAEFDLKRVVELAPDYAEAWGILGNVYAWSDKYEEALTHHKRWLELDPGNPDAAQAVALDQIALRQFHEARKYVIIAQKNHVDPESANKLLRELDRVPQATDWQVMANLTHWTFDPTPADPWTDGQIMLQRKYSGGSLAFGYLSVSRFKQDDTAWRLEGYRDLWNRSYGYLNLQIGPSAAILPEIDGTLELYQGFGEGWESSLSYRRMQFTSDAVDILGGSLARYTGPWYLRLKVMLIPRQTSTEASALGSARRYLGDVDTYLETTLGLNMSQFQMPDGGFIEENGFVGVLHLQHFLTLNWGYGVSYSYHNDYKSDNGQIMHILDTMVYYRF